VDLSTCAFVLEENINRTHLELFPNNRVLTEELLHELRDILVHAAGGMRRQYSISLNAYDHLNRFFDIANFDWILEHRRKYYCFEAAR